MSLMPLISLLKLVNFVQNRYQSTLYWKPILEEPVPEPKEFDTNPSLVYIYKDSRKSIISTLRRGHCCLESSMFEIVEINYSDLSTTAQQSGWKWLRSALCHLEHTKINRDLDAVACDICKMNHDCSSWQDVFGINYNSKSMY